MLETGTTIQKLQTIGYSHAADSVQIEKGNTVIQRIVHNMVQKDTVIQWIVLNMDEVDTKGASKISGKATAVKKLSTKLI